ncbi:MAG TPA: copper homeostasis protein CutC [Bacteroidales bacterium]|nr:copper homeostasis protein CutC [Bacteroidales bacterium]HRZ47798.1 copper homeostasis protein CutC [Bacteroidales bacterium]
MCPDRIQSSYLLEVCAADLPSVRAALEGGAHRVELCSGLAEGGVTPSIGLLMEAMKISAVPVRVLVRARPGDFTWSPHETEAMCLDIRMMCERGAKGFVLGALTPEGDVDMDVMRRMLEAAGNLPWTFHRAFDFCRDPLNALEEIIRLGADTILTSGGAVSALDGASLLNSLVLAAGNRIQIMAGGGISPDNIKEIRIKTGCNAFHLSGRSALPNHLVPSGGAALNAPGLHSDYVHKVTDTEIIGKVISLLNT